MNTSTEIWVRGEIKKQLALCTDGQQTMFKRMYAHNDLDQSISTIVDNMPVEKLEWALSQVERTLEKSK